MPIEPPNPDSVQTILVHEGDAPTTPSGEQFRELAASAFSTWKDSPSGRKARGRIGVGSSPPRVPQFDEDEEDAEDDESQSVPDEASDMELTAYIYASMLALKLVGEDDAGEAVDIIRECLRHTLGPFFGDDKALITGLTEDDPNFARIHTGEWQKKT